MAGVITTGSNPKLLWPGIKAIFGQKYNEHPLEWKEFLEDKTSDKNYEEEVEIPGFGLAGVKDQGGSVSYDSTAQGVTKRYTHVAYGLGFICTEEEIEDNQYAQVAARRAESLAFSMRQTEEVIGASVLNRAFDTNYTGADGKAMIVSDHTSLAGSQSNVLGTAADMSEAAIETMIIQIMQATDSRGLAINLIAQKLVVPPGYAFEAERILKSQLRVGTANNDVNALKSMGLIPGGAAINHYLTDADAWFMKTNAPHGMKRYTRRSTDFQKDGDFDTGNRKHKGTMRFSVGWTDWRGVYGTPGA